MREVHIDEIILTVRQLCIDANIEIRPDTIEAYHKALRIEESEVGREVLEQLIRNAAVAKAQRLPFCQDTGYAVLFVELGQDIHLSLRLLTWPDLTPVHHLLSAQGWADPSPVPRCWLRRRCFGLLDHQILIRN